MTRKEIILRDENVEPEQYEKYISEVPQKEAKLDAELNRLKDAEPIGHKEKVDAIYRQISDIEKNETKSADRKAAGIQVLQVELQERMESLKRWREKQVETAHKQKGRRAYSETSSSLKHGDTRFAIQVKDSEMTPTNVVAVQIEYGEGFRSIESTGGMYEARHGELLISIGPRVTGLQSSGSCGESPYFLEYEKFKSPIGAKLQVWLDSDQP